MKTATKLSHHEKISKLIIESIEAGAGEFTLPWYGGGRPKNGVTGRSYRGTNTAVLMAVGQGRSNEWATFLQWKGVGGKVRKGSVGAPVFLYKPLFCEDENGEQKVKRLLYRESYVFNRDDIEGLPAKAEGPTEIPGVLENAEKFIDKTKAVVIVGGSGAFYSLQTDEIRMPDKSLFKAGGATEAWYQTLLHELGHWTGAESRLNRFGHDRSWRFGGENYAREELVVDIGSSYLCADLNICMAPRPDVAQYIESWLTAIKDDPAAFSKACMQAEAVVSYLFDLTQWSLDSQGEALQKAG